MNDHKTENDPLNEIVSSVVKEWREGLTQHARSHLSRADFGLLTVAMVGKFAAAILEATDEPDRDEAPF